MDDTIINAFKEIIGRQTAPDGPHAVEQAVVAGQTIRVYVGADPNVVDILERAEARFGDREFLIDDGQPWTYAEVFGAARRFAARLQDEYGVGSGDLVGIAMRNRLEWFVAFSAIHYAGGVAVLFNSRGSRDELAAAADDVPCKVIVADAERATRFAEAAVKTPVLIPTADELMSGAGRTVESVRVDKDAPATILFTSGTTGRPKGAVLTQRNLTNMVRNLECITGLNIEHAATLHNIPAEHIKAAMPRLSNLLIVPLFHISGLTAFFLAIENGGLISTLRRWDPAAALDAIERYKVTMVTAPPMVLGDLLRQPGSIERMGSVNNVGVAGQATPLNLSQWLEKALPRAAQSVGWGMTEVSGSVTSASGALYLARRNACGIASPVIDFRIVDEDGREVQPGESGEILVRGPLVMQGYWNAPEATTATITEDGWLRTGDVGYFDDAGFLYLVDRKKDMVITSGENIYCAEVERVLNTDPGFLETALFGVPDEQLGERAIAAVTLREGVVRSEAEVQELVRTHLADYKVPTAVAFNLGAFPRNVTGKVDKAKLRARYLESIKENV